MQHVITKKLFLSTHLSQPIVRTTIGLLTGLVGIADMLSAIVPKLHWEILLGAWPMVFQHRVQPQTLTVVVGFFLILLSYGLARGKRHAWRITIVLALLSALLHILRAGTVLATLVALGLAILLSLLMPFFQAKSDPPSVWRGYSALLLGLGIVVFYTVGGFLALYGEFEVLNDRVGFEDILLRLFTHAHLHIPHGSSAFFFSRAIPVLCVSAVLYGMVQLFRPVAATLLSNAKERNKVFTMTRSHGKSAISYFALDTDKSYFYSTSGKSIISYVLEGSTAVVAGDPIGPDDETYAVIEQFVAFCQEQDWTIVFWQVRATLLGLYRTAGLHALKIGEDAVINTNTFTLKGGAIANVRSSVKRAEKDGLRVELYWGKVRDSEQLAQMERISQAWVAQKGGSEMGFSMGRFDPLGDKELLTAVAVDMHNKVHAFVTFVPIYGRNGYGLDLMRRAEQPAPGTMELLLARSIEYLKERGAAMVSLGLAPQSNANEDDETFLANSIDFLTHRFGDPEKNCSLFNFKKKFQPTWESRYLVYSSTLSLPKIGWALYHAHQRDTSMLKAVRRTIHEWQRNRQSVTAGTLEVARA
ncbi:MAG: hypothetical protein NVS4B11_22590 [Ktedonobacteraceae bacterium]